MEHDVLSRIAAHRQRGHSAILPVLVGVTACALLAGVGVGVANAQYHHTVLSSEAVVLGDEASLAPSSLLANGP